MTKYLVTLLIETDSNPANWDWNNTIVFDDEPTRLVKTEKIND